MMEDVDFSDFIDITPEISNIDFGKSKKPKIFILFDVLLLVGIVWGFLEFFSIIALFSTVTFMCLFFLLGLGIAHLIVDKIKQNYLITEWDSRLVFISVTLNFIVFMSFLNRTEIVTSKKYDSCLIVNEPSDSFKSCMVTLELDGENKEVKIPAWYGLELNKGDKLNLEIKTGLLWFDFCSEATLNTKE